MLGVTINRPSRVFAKGNIIAGIAVGGYLIPQAMAYGDLAGIGPAMGLTMAIIPLLLYPLLGSSRIMSLGPESATALIAATTVAPLIAKYPDSAAVLMGTLTVLMGVILLIARFLRAGIIADLLSHPVLLGYMTGVAVIMVCSQLPKLLGSELDTTNLISTLRTLQFAVPNWTAILVAAVTFIVLWVCSKRLPRLPGAVLALVAATIVGYLLGADTIPDAVFALPRSPTFPPLSELGDLFLAAAAITVVAYSDSILIARAFASNGERVNANQELAAMGTISILNGLIGAYPASSSSTRTAIARTSGAVNRWYSWTVLIMLIATPLLFKPILTLIPVAALAGIVIYAAVSLVDLKGLRSLGKFRSRELGIAMLTATAAVTLGILPGIGIAIGLSIMELLVRMMRPHEGILGFVPGLAGMHDVDDHPHATQLPGLIVFRYDAPLFFANANDFYDKTITALETRPDARWLILNMEANVEVDATGLESLERVHEELHRRGVTLALSRVKHDLAVPMVRYGTMAVIGAENVYPTLPTAVLAFKDWYAAQPDAEPLD